jgi:short-subunit dehydrogenase
MKKHLTTLSYGKWACVIGAAEGLGEAFCDELIRYGFSLLIVDINEEKLVANVNEYKSKNIACKTLFIDLKDPDAHLQINTILDQLEIRFVIYNAAYGPVKSFKNNSLEELDNYLNVNIANLIKIARHLTERSIDAAIGLLFISSLSGFTGSRHLAPYSASKAFIWNFAESLHYEFLNENIDIGVCISGPIDTPNYRATKPTLPWYSPRPLTANFVAKSALKQFGRKLFIVPGISNKLAFALQKLLPRGIYSGFYNQTLQRIYSDSLEDE